MNLTLPSLPPTIGTLTDAQSAALNLRFSQARMDLAHCLTCGGQKTFQWYPMESRDPSEVTTYDCPCRDQYRLSRWLWNSGILLRYQRLGWPDLNRPGFAGLSTYLDYTANSDAYVRAGLGLVLHGPRGTGKTLIAHLLLKELIEAGLDCYATSFEQMVDYYSAGWDDKASAVWFDNRVRNAKVLLVDDLGRERNRGKWTVAEQMLETVVRHRVGCQMPTIFTTNLNPESDNLGNHYGGHTISLLSECSIMCEVDGADIRPVIRERDRFEAQNRLSRPVVLR